MPVTVAIANQGGGVGKSSLSLAFAAGLVKLGKDVILIDGDPQMSLTQVFRFDKQDVPRITNVLDNPEDGILAAVQPTNWDIRFVPSEQALSRWDKSWEAGDEHLLREAIEAKDTGADYVLIDCPPSLAFNTMNALVAADHVVIAAIASQKGWGSLEIFLETLKKVRRRINPDLELAGVVVNQFRENTTEQPQYLAKYQELFDGKLWHPVVPLSAVVQAMYDRATPVYKLGGRYGATRLGIIFDDLTEQLVKATS